MITLGVIGCGHWGPNHIRNFNFLQNASIKTCADLDEDRLKQMKSLYPDIITTTDYMDILNDEEINAVVVATPTATHYKIVKDVFEQGKDVLCEKPMTIDVEESKELVELSGNLNLILMVGNVFLFNAGIQKLRELISEKQLGEIYYVHCTRTNLGPIRDDVNSVYDLASHDVYISNYLLDSKPSKVVAKGEDFLREGVEDLAFISMSYPEKTLVNIHVSWLDPVKVRRITVVGDLKMAIWDDLDNVEPVKVFDKGIIKEPYYDDYGEFQLLTRDGGIYSPRIKLVEPLKNEAMHFIDCVENRKKPICDGENGLDVVKILNMIQESLKKNK